MSESKKRKIQRHVDGRIKVGLMPLPNFFAFLPFAAIIIAVTLKFFNPVTMFIGVGVLGVVGGMFCEFQQKETGIDILKDIIRYKKQGDKYFERSREYVTFERTNRD